MLDMAPLRQNTLIVLAVNAELVPRLWFGALKVWQACHAHVNCAFGGGLLNCVVWELLPDLSICPEVLQYC